MPPVWAEEGNYNKKLDQIDSDINTLQKDLTQNKQARQDLQRQLKRINKELSVRRQRVQKLKKDVKAAKRTLADLQSQQRKEGQKRRADQDSLAKQIRAMQQLGDNPQIKLLLHIDDPADASRLLTYYRYISDSRAAEIAAAETRLSQLKTLKQRATAQQSVLGKKMLALKSKLDEVKQLQQQRNSTLQKIDGRIRSKTKNLGVLQTQRKRLQQLIDEIQRRPPPPPPKKANTSRPASPPVSLSKGRMPWPLLGDVIATFNSLRSAQSQVKWQGILITADYGVDVRAVRSGQVVFSDWLNGYGYLCIVDHGGGYMTLYANNESILPEQGEPVSAGDVIATVGNSGSPKETALYFEVRRNGVAVNPLRWLNKQQILAKNSE